ncbi:Integral membrane protein TerC [Myxococcus hansupus]|uniref:Integral membrane protein TerC n=1 Tax=Pseudomyxococcus hansupus TaxID=1297742 RepID=A0A0H4WSU0_9BACT|nr:MULTISPECIES: TerC family protein [Bacteria]AKQ66536.1 Integral membrane protein TerC [Myxococcus hansupus]MBL0692115.1 TerC family protein [Comamonas sp. JC664]GHG99419.1 membrane protein [Comamonas sp. KCTC 72670]
METFPSVGSPGLWAGFVAFVVAMLALDLGVFHRKAHVVKFKEALGWSAIWVSLALVFGVGVWWKFGPEPGLQFITGYLIEKSLSVDNIFVFVVIFSALRIPSLYQHRVLFWGILSALVLRAIMIFAGVAMLARFHWLIYVFGGFLILTGVKLFLQRNKEDNPEDGALMRLARRTIPSTPNFDGHHFFTVENGRKLATPLLMALLLVEASDILFALDSIPAIFAVTTDPFIVFTSNIFAILGLRSMFFMLAGAVEKFSYLKVGLSAVLVFVGTKMAIIDFVKVPPAVSLGVIAGLLGASIVASLIKARQTPTVEVPKA